tara:strand:+ start:768 stop:1343 length:576 start_codon:yes stop_codon:yes gene_type:complete
MKKLIEIQAELKAPKNQYNKFGKYNYRSKEDILEAVKPLLAAKGLLMTLTDEVKEVGAFTFMETIIRIDDGKDFVESRSCAGIEKAGGMQLPQAFGSAASYSGKYALGNMFLLDDTKDADATNDHSTKQKVTPLKQPIKGTAQKPTLKPNTDQWTKAVKYLVDGGLISAIEGKYALDKVSKDLLMDTVLEA